MRRFVDIEAQHLQAGDVLIEPTTGVLSTVESVDPVTPSGMVALHMRGSVSGSYMGLSCNADRQLRRMFRAGEEY